MDSFDGIKICFLADKHDLFDDRIYWKMAVPLKKRGAEVYYFLIGSSNKEGKTKEGIQYRVWKVKSFSSNPYLNFFLKRLNPKNNYVKMIKACGELQADIYHFHDLWLNRIGPQLKNLPQRPVVFYDAREPYAEDYRSSFATGRFSKFMVKIFASWIDRWEKKKAEQYDLVIANESGVRNRFAEKIGEDKAVVLYNYANTAIWEDNPPNPDSEHESSKPIDLIYCGILTEQRGAWNLLQAVTQLKVKIPDLKVLLLGTIHPPSLETQIRTFLKNHELEETVALQSQVPHEEVWGYYRRSKVGLLLWRPYENLKIKMPIKIFEYMACGLPVVGSNFGHIERMIHKEACGVVVDPENIEEVVAAMESLLRDEHKQATMGNQGLEATKERYNWSLELERLCNYYKNALNER